MPQAGAARCFLLDRLVAYRDAICKSLNNHVVKWFEVSIGTQDLGMWLDDLRRARS